MYIFRIQSTELTMVYGLALPAGSKMQPHKMRDTGHREECASQATGICERLGTGSRIHTHRYGMDREI